MRGCIGGREVSGRGQGEVREKSGKVQRGSFQRGVQRGFGEVSGRGQGEYREEAFRKRLGSFQREVQRESSERICGVVREKR